jgi:O-antigen ligase
LESVEKKIELRGKQDSIFAGRENNWTSILSERKVFGFKKEFIEKQYEIGAHNTFLGILQEYGIICFCFFLMLYIFLLKKIIKILFTTTQLFKYNHLPIMIIISFGMYGFTESFIFTIGNPLVILYLFSIGVIQKKTLVGGINESCSYKVGI